ncbi:hypothetical protein BDZ89DRAFT_1036901 [Hymenopellis radicata]|nr:hypothetical protein BDZ89DRAFT_1036901 [Hymenopellis radicata]
MREASWPDDLKPLHAVASIVDVQSVYLPFKLRSLQGLRAGVANTVVLRSAMEQASGNEYVEQSEDPHFILSVEDDPYCRRGIQHRIESKRSKGVLRNEGGRQVAEIPPKKGKPMRVPKQFTAIMGDYYLGPSVLSPSCNSEKHPKANYLRPTTAARRTVRPLSLQHDDLDAIPCDIAQHPLTSTGISGTPLSSLSLPPPSETSRVSCRRPKTQCTGAYL